MPPGRSSCLATSDGGPLRPPPLRELFGLRPRLPHELARGLEDALDDELVGLRQIVGEARERLHQALIGTVLADDAVALLHRREGGAHRQPGFAAHVLEGDERAELHRLHVVAAAMVVRDAVGAHDLVESDAVLIVAPVGAVHDEAPDAAGAEIEALRGDREAVRAPPMREVLWIGPGLEHQAARRIEQAAAGDHFRILRQIETECVGHGTAPSLASLG